MEAIRIVDAGQLKKDRGGFAPGRHRAGAGQGRRGREGAAAGLRGRGASASAAAAPSASFTVRRISYGVGVERTFPLHSPRIDKIQVTKRAAVRRSKLYYLRDLAGKAARLKEKRLAQVPAPASRRRTGGAAPRAPRTGSRAPPGGAGSPGSPAWTRRGGPRWRGRWWRRR